MSCIALLFNKSYNSIRFIITLIEVYGTQFTGSVMMAIMLFMAITSTGSAEGIAVSSLVAYDIYKAYTQA